MIDRRTMLKALAGVPGLEVADVREIPTKTRAVIVMVRDRPPLIECHVNEYGYWEQKVVQEPEPEIDLDMLMKAFKDAGLGDVKVIVLRGCDIEVVS